MTGTTTLILGGGFAGLSTAYHLRPRLGPEHRISVAERSSTFSSGDGSFFALPQPEMAFSEPDATQLEAKKRWVLDFVRTYLG